MYRSKSYDKKLDMSEIVKESPKPAASKLNTENIKMMDNNWKIKKGEFMSKNPVDSMNLNQASKFPFYNPKNVRKIEVLYDLEISKLQPS